MRWRGALLASALAIGMGGASASNEREPIAAGGNSPCASCHALPLEAPAAAAYANAEEARSALRARVSAPALSVEAVSGDEATRDVLARGHALWTRRFANGRSLAGCFPYGGRLMATVHPRFDARLGRVVTLETAINQCLKAHGEPLFEPADPDAMGAVTAYVRYLAAGQRLSIRVDSAAAESAFEAGQRLFHAPIGPNGHACAHCHVTHAGEALGGGAAPPAATRLAITWPAVKNGRAVSLQGRARECLSERMGATAPPEGLEPLANLDFFLSFLASGQPLVPNPASP